MRGCIFIFRLALTLAAPDAAHAQSTQSSPAPADTTLARAVDVRALLVPGRHAADIMELGAQPRVLELVRRLQQAVQRDTAFFREYLKAARPDSALAYHPKMGLTEAEYREYLVLSQQVIPRKVGTATLVISADSTGLLLDAGETVPALRGVRVDLTGDTVRTSLGALADGAPLRSDQMQSLAGRWSGVQWQMPQGMGAAVSLTIGKLDTVERGIINYEVRYVDESGRVASLTTLLHYDLAPLPETVAKAKKPVKKPKKTSPKRPVKKAAARPPA